VPPFCGNASLLTTRAQSGTLLSFASRGMSKAVQRRGTLLPVSFLVTAADRDH
jgi:hypothetical protein